MAEDQEEIVIDDDELFDFEDLSEHSRSDPNLALVDNFDNPQPESQIRILVASDLHVGFGEGKEAISRDALNTFEEVLQIAKKKKADMLLLGGDLFHENKPSREAQLDVTRLLRHYCLDDTPVALQFLSDPAQAFPHSKFKRVNYDDENLNVGLPVFTIHGNHDDMCGEGLTALDTLHEAGLLNLFGKFDNLEKMEVYPLLFRKGVSRLAIYGIGSQRDDRLSRAFCNDKIKFLTDKEDYFNILVLHQNRPKRSNMRNTGAFLPEKYIPTLFDLVIWGHEHDCQPRPVPVYPNGTPEEGFHILQPGSTVATSLMPGETKPKHCFLITVQGQHFTSEPLRLQTTRQIFLHNLIFDELLPEERRHVGDREENMRDELTIVKTIELLLQKAANSRGEKQPELPLLRLKVIYSGVWATVPSIHPLRLGTCFSGRVANHEDMLVVRKVSERASKARQDAATASSSASVRFIPHESIEASLQRHFTECPRANRLSVLCPFEMATAMKNFDPKENKSKENFDAQIEKMCQRLQEAFPIKERAAEEELPEKHEITEEMLREKIEEWRGGSEDVVNDSQDVNDVMET